MSSDGDINRGSYAQENRRALDSSHEQIAAGQEQLLLVQREAVSSVLSISDENNKQLSQAAKKLDELARRRTEGVEKLSHSNLDLNFVWQLACAGIPLQRSHLHHETGWQPLVLTHEDITTLGCLSLVLPNGEQITIEPESMKPGDLQIFYPNQLGDLPSQKLDQSHKDEEQWTFVLDAMRNILLEIVGDRSQYEKLEPNKQWDAIVSEKKYAFAAVTEGRRQGLPEIYLRKFALLEIFLKLMNGDVGIAARMLTNLGFATPDQVERFMAIAVRFDSTLADSPAQLATVGANQSEQDEQKLEKCKVQAREIINRDIGKQ